MLVYLSGIEKSFLEFYYKLWSWYWFSTNGSEWEIGIYQQILAELDAPMLNIYDGSFISSKLISEFGVIGALMCIFYFFIFPDFICRFKKMQKIFTAVYFSI